MWLLPLLVAGVAGAARFDSFELDLDANLLTLAFTGAVDAQTLDVPSLLLGSSPAMADALALSNSSAARRTNGTAVYVDLSADDALRVRDAPAAAKSLGTTFLAVSNASVLETDADDSWAQGDTLGAAGYQPDTLAPGLVGWDFDRDRWRLTVRFSEPMNLTQWSLALFTIQEAESSNRGQYHAFAEPGELLSVSELRTEVVAAVAAADVLAAQLLIGLGADAASSFLSTPGGVLRDTAGNALDKYSEYGALPADAFAADATPAVPVSFELDMLILKLYVTFSKAVRFVSYDWTLATLHSADGAQAYTLTGTASGALVTAANGDTVEIDLGAVDANEIKARDRLATNAGGASSVVLTALAGLAYDTNVVPVPSAAVNLSAAVPAAALVPDTFEPALLAVTLDLTDGLLELEFDESVNHSSVALADVALYSNASTTDSSFALSLGAAAVESRNNSRVRVALDVRALAQLRFQHGRFGSSVDLAYVDVPAGAVEDTSRNAFAGTDGARQVDAVVPDSAAPEIESWTFDLTTGNLTLRLSEPVRDVDVSALALSGFALSVNGTAVVRLTDLDQVAELWLVDDLMSLKSALLEPSELAASAQFATDKAGNPLAPVDALPVATLVADTTAPELESWTLDLDALALRLEFAEPVLGASLDVTALAVDGYALTDSFVWPVDLTSHKLPVFFGKNDTRQIQALAMGGPPSLLHMASDAVLDTSPLELGSVAVDGLARAAVIADATPPELMSFALDPLGPELVLRFSEPVNASSLDLPQAQVQDEQARLVGTVQTIAHAPVALRQSADGRTLVLELDAEDTSALTGTSAVGNARRTTFLSWAEGLVADVAGNALPARDQSDGLLEGPALEWWTADLDAGELVLYFSEEMTTSGADVTGMAVNGYALSSSIVSSAAGGGVMVTVALSKADLDGIKATGSGLELELDVGDSALRGDSTGNGNIPAAGVVPTLTTLDETSPTLVGWTLDMSVGELVLQFDEPVNGSSLNMTAWSVQEGAVWLTAASEAQPAAASNVTVDLTTGGVLRDVDRLARAAGVAELANATTLSALSTAAADTAGNPLAPVDALLVTTLVADSTAPELESWSLDLNTLQMTLRFSEALDTEAGFALDHVEIADLPLLAADKVRLSGDYSTYEYADGGTSDVVVQLRTEDAWALTRRSDVATAESSAYVTLLAGAAQDLAGLPVARLNTGLQASLVVRDETPPRLEYVAANMSSAAGFAELTLRFSEAVNTTSFSPAGVFLAPGHALSSATYAAGESDGEVVLVLRRRDLDAATGAGLLLSLNSTSVEVTEAAFQDMSRNGVAPETVHATHFTPDHTRPQLWSMEVDNYDLHLFFSESVNASGLDLSQVHLRLDGTTYAWPEGAVLQTGSGAELVWTADSAGAAPFGTGWGDFSVFCEEGFASDMFGNPVEAVSLSDAFPVGPRVVAFDLNMNNERLTVELSEVWDNTRINMDDLTLVARDSALKSARPRVVLDNVVDQYLEQTDYVLVAGLGADNAAALQAEPLLATRAENTFLVVDTAVTSWRSNLPTEDYAPLAVRDFVADTTPPTLKSVDLDMDSGAMLLQFSETVQTATLVVGGGVSLLSLDTADGLGLQSFTLTDAGTARVTTSNASSVELLLGQADLDELRLLQSLAVDQASTFALMADDSVRDMAGLSLAGMEAPAPAAAYVADATAPVLQAWELDMDLGELRLDFDEAVRVSLLDTSGLAMASDAGVNATSVPLTGATSTSSNGASISLLLGPDDMDALVRAPSVGVSGGSFLVAATGTFADMAENPSVAVAGLAATSVTPDSTLPSVYAFTLDAASGTLTLMFSEIVNATSLRVAAITVASQASGGLSYTLTDGVTTRASDEEMLREVELSLGADLASFPAGLADSQATTYLTAAAELVRDLASPPLSSAAITAGMPEGPVLLRYTLDLDADELLLTFSHAVNGTRLNASAVVLQASAAGGAHVRLSESNSTSAESATVSVVLAARDVNAIKSLAGLARSAETTYLTLDAGSVPDLTPDEPNWAVPVLNGSAQAAGVYFADSQGPQMLRFTIDMTARTVFMEFDEPCEVLDLDSTQLTLTSGTEEVTLAASPVDGSGRFARVYIDDATFRALGKARSLAINAETTFLRATSTLVVDVVGNALQPGTLQASEFVGDTTGPELETFAVDLEARTLTLEFDEIVNATTLDATGLQLQQKAKAVDGQTYRLQDSALLAGEDNVVTVWLGDVDLYNLQLRQELVVDVHSAFLSIRNTTVEDLSGNLNIEVLTYGGIKSEDVVVDSTAPVLESFSLDMDGGVLVATFSEVMDASSFDASGFALQAAQFVGGADSLVRELTAGDTALNSTADAASLTIVLGADDVVAIKQRVGLGTSADTTWLTVAASAVADMQGLAVTAVSDGFAVQAQSFSPDVTIPELLSWDVDAVEWTLTLHLSEVGDADALDVGAITLQQFDSAAYGDVLTLSAATAVPSGSERSLVLQLDDDDVLALLPTGLLKSARSSFLVMPAGTVVDMAGNGAVRIVHGGLQGGGAMQASGYVGDTTAPTVLRGLVSDGRVTLYMDEWVSAASVDVGKLWLGNQSLANATVEEVVGGAVFLSGVSSLASASADTLTVGAGAMADLAVPGNFVAEDATVDVGGVDCSECPSGSFQSAACSEHRDRECSACTECAAGEFAATQCSAAQDAVCRRCTECDGGAFAATECSATADAVCAACTVCSSDEYEYTACAGDVNRVCLTCDSCTLSPAATKLCRRSSFSWRRANCCVDSEGTSVPCAEVLLRDMEIDAELAGQVGVFA